MSYDAYDTQLTKNYRMDVIKQAISRNFIESFENYTDKDDSGRGHEGLYLMVGQDNDVAPFAHPIFFDRTSLNTGLADFVVVDVRPYVRQEGSGYRVTNSHDYNFHLKRGLLAALWSTEERERLLTTHSMSTTAYGRWLGESIRQKLGLNPDDQNIITILAIAYYMNRFVDPMDLDSERHLTKLVIQVGRYTHTDLDRVEQFRNEFSTLITIDDLIASIKKCVENPRIEMLSYALMVSVLTYGWRGAHAKEIMAVAIEHPPTWLAVIITALTTRVVRESPVAKIVWTLGKDGSDRAFLSAIARLISHGEQDG